MTVAVINSLKVTGFNLSLARYKINLCY